MLNFRDCLLSQHEACYCSLQSVGESCPAQARTLRLDYQSHFCRRASCGRNLRSRLVSFERRSSLRHLFHGHSTLQNLPNHRDRSCTLHLSFRQTYKLPRSSYRLKKKETKQNDQNNEKAMRYISIIIYYCPYLFQWENGKNEFPTFLFRATSFILS